MNKYIEVLFVEYHDGCKISVQIRRWISTHLARREKEKLSVWYIDIIVKPLQTWTPGDRWVYLMEEITYDGSDRMEKEQNIIGRVLVFACNFNWFTWFCSIKGCCNNCRALPSSLWLSLQTACNEVAKLRWCTRRCLRRGWHTYCKHQPCQIIPGLNFNWKPPWVNLQDTQSKTTDVPCILVTHSAIYPFRTRVPDGSNKIFWVQKLWKNFAQAKICNLDAILCIINQKIGWFDVVM